MVRGWLPKCGAGCRLAGLLGLAAQVRGWLRRCGVGCPSAKLAAQVRAGCPAGCPGAGLAAQLRGWLPRRACISPLSTRRLTFESPFALCRAMSVILLDFALVPRGGVLYFKSWRFAMCYQVIGARAAAGHVHRSFCVKSRRGCETLGSTSATSILRT